MFSEERFAPVAVLAVAASQRTTAGHGCFCPNASPAGSAAVKGGATRCSPNWSVQEAAGTGGCGVGEVGVGWRENLLWDVPLGARCGGWVWCRKRLESGLEGTSTSGRKPVLGTDAACGVDSLSVLSN